MFKRNGFRELARQLDRVARSSEEMDGTHSVPLGELLTPEFLASHTRFGSLAEMLAAGGFPYQGPADLDRIPRADWEAFIRRVSAFSDWESMLGAAVAHYTRSKLGG